MPVRCCIALALIWLTRSAPPARPQPQTPRVSASAAPASNYYLFVASEAADQIALLRFGPGGLEVERTIDTGIMPNDIDGPHGLAVTPDRKSFFVSMAHGQPFGAVWKYAVDLKVVARATLGMFPATLSTSPDGEFLYVVNFNLHGDMVPSSVSVLTTEPLQEIARIRTCRMPHGSRVNPQGTRHYSACMMDDVLVEIDTGALRVSRHFVLTRGRERGGDGAPAGAAPPSTIGLAGGHGTETPPAGSAACSPTWAQPSADGRSVFVACNGTSELVEIDGATWAVKRRLTAATGIYNLAVSGDGRLLATNRRDQSVSIYDARDGRELKRLRTSRRVVHGVVVTPDDRYAFVTVEGVGAEPGAVEVIDLSTLTTVGVVDVGPQAGGIDFWKMDGSDTRRPGLQEDSARSAQRPQRIHRGERRDRREFKVSRGIFSAISAVGDLCVLCDLGGQFSCRLTAAGA